MEYGTTGARRILTMAEVDQLREAFRDPEYVSRLLADCRQSDMVEVDNPVRREVRPRRGKE